MLSHANIAANMSQIDKWGCGLFYPPSKVVAVLPFFHIFAMTVCMNVPLCNGTQVVMLPRFELKALLDLMHAHRRQRPAGGADAARRHRPGQEPEAGAARQARGRGLGRRRRCPTRRATAFAKISQGAARRRLRPHRSLAGGLLRGAARAVASRCRSASPCPRPTSASSTSTPARRCRSASAASCRSRARRSCSATTTNEEATKDAFMDGWLRTGDVGYMDEDGYVFLVDRIKDLIICSGFNVYPRTIEEALMRAPGGRGEQRHRRPRRVSRRSAGRLRQARARARRRPSRSSRPSSAKSSTSSRCPRRSSSRTSCPRR